MEYESKFQKLASQYEQLRMEEDETIVEFDAKLRCITDMARQLGKTYTDYKLVMKTLRSLPPRLYVKKVCIEECRDLTKTTLDELMASLHAHEIEHPPPRRAKKEFHSSVLYGRDSQVYNQYPCVREAKLQILATQFHELRMEKDETIFKFLVRIREITNVAYQLGKTYKDYKLVMKTLRSLPQRFAVKVCAMREARDLTTMTLDEVMGSLRAHEMMVLEEKKVKDDDDELAKNFSRMLKKNSQERTTKSRMLHKGIQCMECKGYGHIKTECANILKKQMSG